MSGVPTDPAGGERNATAGGASDALPDLQTLDVDMAAQLTLEQSAFVPSGSGGPSAPSETIANERSPAARAGLASGLMLALRFVQARFLSVWGLIVAAALCPAQAFADFALFSASANLVSIAALLRFEAVFFQSGEQERLGRAFRLALAVAVAFVAIAMVVIATMVLDRRIGAITGGLFLLTLAARAVIRLITSEATAEGDFAAIGNLNIVQALVQPGLMVLFITSAGASATALFAADALGHSVSAVYLIVRRRRALASLCARPLWAWSELAASARRWRNAPGFLLPSSLLSFGFMVFPLLALPKAQDPLFGAHVALAMRLLEVPTQMFAAVSVPLVLNSLRSHPAAERQSWVRLLTLGLMLAATGLFATIALAAMTADALLDDTQWAGVGDVVALMTLFYGAVALVTPLHEMASLSQHPRRQLGINGLSLAAAAAAMVWIGTLSPGFLTAIGFIAFARMLAHIHFAWTRFGGAPGEEAGAA